MIQDFYITHLLDFPGKTFNLGLAALHDFGGCAKRTNARFEPGAGSML